MRVGKMAAIFKLCALGVIFAAPSQAQEIFFDDFESGGTSKTQNGVRWGGSNSTAVSRDIARSGNYSLRFRFDAASSGEDSFAEQRFALGRDYKELYIEWYAYYPNGTEGLGAKYVHRDDEGPDNNKLVRVWKGDTGDGNDGYSDYYVKGGASTTPASGGSRFMGEYGWDGAGVGSGPFDAPNAASHTSFITDAQLGRWIKIKVRVRAATNGSSDGVIAVWRDDVLLSSTTNLPWHSRDGHTSAFNFGYLLGWANSGFSSTTNVYIDDVRISTSDTSDPQPRAPENLSVQ